MAALILYSVNCYLKYHIQEKYRGGVHYVWVSESYDSRSRVAPVTGPQPPPTSNPKDIYERLKLAVDEADEHDYKIIEQKGAIIARAIGWEAKGEISTSDKDEIVYIAENGPFKQWRPLIYVIPFAPVASRIETVPRGSRAGLGPEYRIADLRRSEFDIIE